MQGAAATTAGQAARAAETMVEIRTATLVVAMAFLEAAAAAEVADHREAVEEATVVGELSRTVTSTAVGSSTTRRCISTTATSSTQSGPRFGFRISAITSLVVPKISIKCCSGLKRRMTNRK